MKKIIFITTIMASLSLFAQNEPTATICGASVKVSRIVQGDPNLRAQDALKLYVRTVTDVKVCRIGPYGLAIVGITPGGNSALTYNY